ncbi:MAG: FHA domain-containing protein [Lachnospiraceae bacterium]|nr:FHA domain-containing protein [Lachnospiraceae bacterium]
MKEELNGRYVKEYLQTYLILPFSGDVDELYKLKMLENNRSEEILDVNLTVDGGAPFCKYPIGGRKSMDLVFRTLSIDYIRLLQILKSFAELFDETAELLLNPDDVVLQPEYVFVNISDYKASFVYLPGYSKSIEKQAEVFFEYMLNRVDYDDKRAVGLLYDCYVLVMKEEQGLKALKERLDREAPAPIGAFDKETVEQMPEIEKIPSETKPEPSVRKWFSGRLKKKKELENSRVACETERLFEDDARDTVLLQERREACNPCLVCMRNDEKIVMEKFPFTIGSLSGHTDYTPASGNISRLHAEIRQIGGKTSLFDLNSTNGTRLNGRELIPGEEYPLSNNDKISIADVDLIYKDGRRAS